MVKYDAAYWTEKRMSAKDKLAYRTILIDNLLLSSATGIIPGAVARSDPRPPGMLFRGNW